MKLREFITWVASAPGIALATYGFKRQAIAPEEMYHSAAEMKRAMDRHEAANMKDREREHQYWKNRAELQAKCEKEAEERVAQQVASIQEENRLLRERNTKLRDFMKKT